MRHVTRYILYAIKILNIFASTSNSWTHYKFMIFLSIIYVGLTYCIITMWKLMRTRMLPYLLSFFVCLFFVFQPICSALLCICFSHISRHVCVSIYIFILISRYREIFEHMYNIYNIYKQFHLIKFSQENSLCYWIYINL